MFSGGIEMQHWLKMDQTKEGFQNSIEQLQLLLDVQKLPYFVENIWDKLFYRGFFDVAQCRIVYCWH